MIPTVLAGSFLYLGGLQGDAAEPDGYFTWAATMATIMATCAAAVQTGSMIVAASYLEKVRFRRYNLICSNHRLDYFF